MAELHLTCNGDVLTVTIGEHSASVPWAEVALNERVGQYIYDDADTYGRTLFKLVMKDEHLRFTLNTLRVNERLVLVTEDPSVAAIPWEYLRGPDNTLLASRLSFVRSIPGAQRQYQLPLTSSLKIVAIPASPVDDQRMFDAEREWQQLVEAVITPRKVLTLIRARPPTLTQMEQALPGPDMSIVHFMGRSGNRQGKAVLFFEGSSGQAQPVDATSFAHTLDDCALLVVLDRCLSAVIAGFEFDNIAQAVLQEGLPYLLGTQFVLPDYAAGALNKALYSFLLKGHSIEEAVRRTRQALEYDPVVSHPLWLAGMPVLYTSLREAASPLSLKSGQPLVQPDPERLQANCDLTDILHAKHFLGRGKEISMVLEILLAQTGGFVMLQGPGAVGKTALAHAIGERISWHYNDQVLAVSFEPFVRYDTEHNPMVNDQFSEHLYYRLAHFYGLDSAQYLTTTELQQAILQHRRHLRSLLILDKVEILIEAEMRDNASAKALVTFIKHLKESDGTTLLTSRSILPPEWGECIVVKLTGLSDDIGSDLFLAFLPSERQRAASLDSRLALNRLVQGHPLSIRLLAGRFSELSIDLATFLPHIEVELAKVEQDPPASREGFDHQRALYACIDYSIKRLTPEQTKVLHAISIFQAPFPPNFAAAILDNDEQVPIHLQNLVRLGLLESKTITFPEGEMELLELHPVLRQYIQYHMPELESEWKERYGLLYEYLEVQAIQSEKEYSPSPGMRYLASQSLPDSEMALQYLKPAVRGALAQLLAKRYEKLGQELRALTLYKQACELYQELGEMRNVALTQRRIAGLLRRKGRPQEALALYEQALHTVQDLGEMREVAITQNEIADLFVDLGRPQEALALYEQALHTAQGLADMESLVSIQRNTAYLLSLRGRFEEALALLEQALRAMQGLNNLQGVLATQGEMADLLRRMGRSQEALTLYEQALRILRDLGDDHAVAVTQQTMAGLLREMGRPQEALALFEQALYTTKELGEIRGVAIVQQALAGLLGEMNRFQDALVLFEQALGTLQDLGDVREVAVTEGNFSQFLFEYGEYNRALALAWQSYHKSLQGDFVIDTQAGQAWPVSMKKRSKLQSEQFDAIWEQVISEPQPDWLREVQAGSAGEQSSNLADQLDIIVANTVIAMTGNRETRTRWRETITGSLRRSRAAGLVQDAEFLAGLLAVLDGKVSTLPEAHPYADGLAAIQKGIAAGGIQNESVMSEALNESMQVVLDLIGAVSWEMTRQIMEARQDILFQPGTEAIFEQLIAQYRTDEDQPMVELLEMHLTILHSCKALGIAETFEQITMAEEDYPDDR